MIKLNNVYKKLDEIKQVKKMDLLFMVAGFAGLFGIASGVSSQDSTEEVV